jgi:hypothetical protein
MEHIQGDVYNSSLVCRLNKSMYALKHEPRVWYTNMDSYLLSQDFIHCKSDPNVYMLRNNDPLLIIVSYVEIY